ncbi:MAG: DUF2752 domain-containing protein, partial [Niameybacter sp.]
GYKIIVGTSFIVLGILMIKGVGLLSSNQTTCIFDILGGRCLGCNIRAALYALSKGEWKKAFYLNPLVYPWILLGVSLIVSEIYTIIRRLSDKQYKKESLLDWIVRKMFKGVTF